MKFQEKNFSEELKEKIEHTELVLQDFIEKWLLENKHYFAIKSLQLDADFNREGQDPFKPGYSSSIAIGISDNVELVDLHLIKIWECERLFLGLRVSPPLPGSKIVGELLDESVVDIQEEVMQYLKQFLEDEE